MSTSRITKAIAFSAQSSENHTTIKIKSVIKWLKTGHEIRVQINGRADRHRAMETIFKQLENDIKSGAKFLQKVVKPESIKFTLVPTEEATNLETEKAKTIVNADKEIRDIIADRDILSGEFEKELEKSIRQERSKNKKR